MNDRGRSDIRDQLLRRRRALQPGEALNAGASLAEPVCAQLEQNVPRSGEKTARGVVAAYQALPGEISPAAAIEQLGQSGWSIVLPVCGRDRYMDFCPWSPGDELVQRAFGVLEPLTAPIAATTIDAVIVPGVAFDRLGNRLGHGVGFYDRFFERCTQQSHNPYRLGIAYDFQIVELPAPEPWDIPMHSVVSPSEVIDTALCE